ncbi:TonB-dependent receptor plug domain-containing protein [candidate division WWE3 bacterium]|uniref:TonB-dependent receptor plug domain-containing protein n=1 Tax=candidate division WWE3 bacterium TaxID=2053526 RepID=A0A928TWS4_UNCKA|nr:TonB-dependent receptor plug domain-containing protein [candidate division WWE3 bacterium]
MNYSHHELYDARRLRDRWQFKPAAATLLILLLDAPDSHAQTTSKDVELPGVVIAAPAASSSESIGFKADAVVQGDRLRRNRAANLGDTLSHELGVSSSSFGPGAGRPIIRGQDGPRVQILENGIGTGDLSVISPDHAVATETLSASRIEILQGPATLLYGSGVSGGTVNVINARIPDRLFKAPQANFEGLQFRAGRAQRRIECVRQHGQNVMVSRGKQAAHQRCAHSAAPMCMILTATSALSEIAPSTPAIYRPVALTSASVGLSAFRYPDWIISMAFRGRKGRKSIWVRPGTVWPVIWTIRSKGLSS